MANVRWNLAIPEETDRSVRMHLAATGGKKGDLSSFVRKAVAWELLRRASAEAKQATKHIPEDEMMALIDEALEWARNGEGRTIDVSGS
jgi:creatinine amidohydrolase/Fe(II)-dependent formamide hydrolase-like protein